MVRKDGESGEEGDAEDPMDIDSEPVIALADGGDGPADDFDEDDMELGWD